MKLSGWNLELLQGRYLITQMYIHQQILNRLMFVHYQAEHKENYRTHF